MNTQLPATQEFIIHNRLETVDDWRTHWVTDNSLTPAVAHLTADATTTTADDTPVTADNC